MQIKTKTFNITPKEFRQLLASYYFRQRRNLLISYGVLLVITFLLPFDEKLVFLRIYFLFLFAFGLVAPFFINLKKTQSILNFIARYWEIDENFISIYYEDGSLSKLRFEHLVKAIKLGEYYLLFMTAAGYFHYLPISAFESEKDIHRFDLFLKGKQLIKLW
ncbi:YcxB family protein [Nostocaceae cyanobacterium CENA369]|uniref:YcxB family protein n=1 Tax=Dendronalium phyllosphericum CENA369 TaxID=1725256 RepID=A0A8J7I278_9NOST|nr:YcxB family protein [Dendronalium phyllosphericum]MBH8572228.1 YcxB family protein [Dendronalium phyllosphericum CENA369]